MLPTATDETKDHTEVMLEMIVAGKLGANTVGNPTQARCLIATQSSPDHLLCLAH